MDIPMTSTEALKEATDSQNFMAINQAVVRAKQIVHEDLTEFLEREVTGKGREVGKIHPSQLWNCLRQNYYMLNGLQPDSTIKAQSRITFDIGHAYHGMLERYFKGMFPEHFDSEYPIYNYTLAQKIGITGHCDGYLRLPELHLVLEFKTINDHDFKKLNEPEDKHIKQVTIYCAVLHAPLAVILYIDKNDGHMKSYVVPYNETTWNECRQRINTLRVHQIERRLPDKTDNPRECGICGYRNKCHADDGITLSNKNS